MNRENKILHFYLNRYLPYLLFIFMLISCSPSYRSFISGDKKYYEKIADSCDYLIVKAKNPPKTWDTSRETQWLIKADDNSLPSAIKNLHPNYIMIYLNHKSVYSIGIFIGISRNSYVVGWGKDNYWNNSDKNIWSLSTSGEGGISVLYTRKDKSNTMK